MIPQPTCDPERRRFAFFASNMRIRVASEFIDAWWQEYHPDRDVHAVNGHLVIFDDSDDGFAEPVSRASLEAWLPLMASVGLQVSWMTVWLAMVALADCEPDEVNLFRVAVKH